MKTRVERYQECVATCAELGFYPPRSVSEFNRAVDEMRALVDDAYRAGPEAVAEFFPLLDEAAVARSLAFTLLDRGQLPPAVEGRCLATVRDTIDGGGPEAITAEWWLREWEAKNPEHRRAGAAPAPEVASVSDWADVIEAISDHVERHIGPIHRVFHELVSDGVHIDLHWVQPSPDRQCHTLVTSGMSEHPMNVPPGAEEFSHAELVLNLPADWPMSTDSWSDERHGWPIALLKRLARYPYQQATWLWMDHTVGEPGGQPYGPGTRQSAAVISPCVSAPIEFSTLEFGGRKVHFFSVMPLYEDELSYKMRKGADALYARFAKADVRDIVAPDRPAVCGRTRKGLLRWFRD